MVFPGLVTIVCPPPNDSDGFRAGNRSEWAACGCPRDRAACGSGSSRVEALVSPVCP